MLDTGKPDEGAEVGDGTTEAQSNLKIALILQNLLEQSGCTVILTRSDENGIYDLDSNTLKQKKISDIRNRVKIGNESSADIFVSIHLNKIPQEQYDGWQTFYNKNSEQGQKLAKLIQSNLNEAIQKENKRVAAKIENIYIIKNVEEINKKNKRDTKTILKKFRKKMMEIYLIKQNLTIPISEIIRKYKIPHHSLNLEQTRCLNYFIKEKELNYALSILSSNHHLAIDIDQFNMTPLH